MNKDLQNYLNDHFSGAAAGLALVTRLAETATDQDEENFLHNLCNQISTEKDALAETIQEAGFQLGAIRQAVGAAVARAGIWRMELHGLDLGDLGRFEMIELLAAGIHGKLLLWKTLYAIQEDYPAWSHRNFLQLQDEAEEQCNSLEVYRIREGRLMAGSRRE